MKSIANLTGTLHLLAGTYELLDLCDFSAELARRTYDVHPARYGESARDEGMFANVVRSLQMHLPLATQADLAHLAGYLYERSLGCVGILKEWLTESLLLALEEGCSTVSERDLEKTGYAPGKLEAIRREEIELGERHRRELDGVATVSAPLPSAVLEPVKAAFGRRPGKRRPVRNAVPVV